MMTATAILEFLRGARAWLRTMPVVYALVSSFVFAVLVFSALGFAFYVIEKSTSRDTTRYRTRHFLNDIVYTLLYQGGIYNVLIYAPLYALIAPRFGFMKVGLVTNMSPAASIAIYWFIADFVAYWVHRIQHRVPLLWAFHSVHHTQTQMTFLTSNRNHVVEQIYVNLFLMGPGLLLGMPAHLWMPLFFAQTFFEHAQHAQLRWSYGSLHKVLVSPAFHAMHHSTEEREYNGNYAKIFAGWDVLFGTFVDSSREPARYGVDGMDVPESLSAQFIHPFRVLGRLTHRRVIPTISETPDPRANAS